MIGSPISCRFAETYSEIDEMHKRQKKFFFHFTLVSPAIGATLQTFLDLRALITELFPANKTSFKRDFGKQFSTKNVDLCLDTQ